MPVCQYIDFYKHGFLSFSIGGLILDKTESNPNLAGMLIYAPVINGELLSFVTFSITHDLSF